MKDRTGQELRVGDTVVMTDSHYRELIVGKIWGFSEKKVRIVVSHDSDNWLGQGQEGRKVHKFPSQVSLANPYVRGQN